MITAGLPDSRPHPPLPRIGDPCAALLLEAPAWRYRSGCAAGYGVAVLRLYGAGEATLAVVTETGTGASITNSAEEIWQDLTVLLAELGRDPRGLVVVEHWPADQSAPDHIEHADQMTAGPGGARWRHLGPHARPGSEEAAWWRQTGRALIAG